MLLNENPARNSPSRGLLEKVGRVHKNRSNLVPLLKLPRVSQSARCKESSVPQLDRHRSPECCKLIRHSLQISPECGPLQNKLRDQEATRPDVDQSDKLAECGLARAFNSSDRQTPGDAPHSSEFGPQVLCLNSLPRLFACRVAVLGGECSDSVRG